MKNTPIFLNISTFFQSESSRNIKNLSSIYNDYERLKKAIHILIHDKLTEKEISGKSVLIKPNWVMHSTVSSDEFCLKTNDAFILAALENIIQLKPKKIIIGDAPIQGCDWGKLVSDSFIVAVKAFSEKYNINIDIKDFRRVTFNPKENNPIKERRPLSEYLIFDLGQDSYLEEISRSDKNIFRVTDYHPDKLAESHKPGTHKYCITKDFFECDVILSLPKVKTHQKAGITNALKNIVGINGDKDFLPHHRIGGTKQGGDCYPGNKPILHFAELALDQANKLQGKSTYKFWKLLAFRLWRLSFPSKRDNLSAAWHGNDTTWRMVMDLNKIAKYGCADGTISVIPQRLVFSLCDGIIGGQGNGPLKPDPLPFGIICFTNDSALADIAMCKLMGFDSKKIPLLRIASQNITTENATIQLNKKTVDLKKLVEYSTKTIPPPGWIKYL